jgi:hypothetical protein
MERAAKSAVLPVDQAVFAAGHSVIINDIASTGQAARIGRPDATRDPTRYS